MRRVLSFILAVLVAFGAASPAYAAIPTPNTPQGVYDAFTAAAEAYANSPTTPKTIGQLAAAIGASEPQTAAMIARGEQLLKQSGAPKLPKATMGNLAGGLVLGAVVSYGLQATTDWLVGTTSYYKADGTYICTGDSLDSWGGLRPLINDAAYMKTTPSLIDRDGAGPLPYEGFFGLGMATDWQEGGTALPALGDGARWTYNPAQLPHGIQAVPAAPEGTGEAGVALWAHIVDGGGGVISIPGVNGYEYSPTSGKLYQASGNLTTLHGTDGQHYTVGTLSGGLWKWLDGVGAHVSVTAPNLSGWGTWLDTHAPGWRTPVEVPDIMTATDFGVSVASDGGAATFVISGADLSSETLGDAIETISVPNVVPPTVTEPMPGTNEEADPDAENKAAPDVLTWLKSFWTSLTDWVRNIFTVSDDAYKDQVQPLIVGLKLSAANCWPFAGAFVMESVWADAQLGTGGDTMEWFLDLTPPDNFNFLGGGQYGVWIRPISWLAPFEPWRWAFVAGIAVMWILALYSLLKPKVHV